MSAPDISTTTVQQLTVEWAAQVLDEPDVAPEDNFLDLGGHSILALRLCRRAKERFGAEYDLMVLFEEDLATAAAELAARIATRS
jgi:aryl carrier-like protein